MTNQEALNNIKEALPNPFAFKKELEVLEKAIIKADKYDEKETPKKMITTTFLPNGENNSFFEKITYKSCPVCGGKESSPISNDLSELYHYCPECGTALYNDDEE